MLVWREWIGDGNVDNWNVAVADVHWVTIQLCDAIYYNPRAAASTGTKRKLELPTPDITEGRSKRVKATKRFHRLA